MQIQVLPFTSHTTFGKSFHLVQTQFHRLSVGMVTLPPSRVSWGLEDNRGQAPGLPSAQDKHGHQPFISHEFGRHTLSMAIVATVIVFTWYFSLTCVLTDSPSHLWGNYCYGYCLYTLKTFKKCITTVQRATSHAWRGLPVPLPNSILILWRKEMHIRLLIPSTRLLEDGAWVVSD